VCGREPGTRTEQKESKQKLKDTQRAVQAVGGQPAPQQAAGDASAAGGPSKQKAMGGARKNQVSTVSLGSFASGALSAVLSRGNWVITRRKGRLLINSVMRQLQISVNSEDTQFNVRLLRKVLKVDYHSRVFCVGC
jgi:hypothetical protein